MRLRLRGLSRPEDDFEAWVAQRHQERVLEGNTTPAGPCPDEAFLKELAKKSKRIALGDPRVGHAANCPICMRRLLPLRREHHSRRLRLVLTAAAASCLLIAALFVGLTRGGPNSKQQTADLAAVPESVDLWNAGTFRGEQPGPLQAVSLPAALVKVTIIPPRYSDPGQYAVAVTRDQEGNDLLARASAAAIGNGDREEVSVYLDLRKSHPGSISFQRPMSKIRPRTTTPFKSGSESSEAVQFPVSRLFVQVTTSAFVRTHLASCAKR